MSPPRCRPLAGVTSASSPSASTGSTPRCGPRSMPATTPASACMVARHGKLVKFGSYGYQSLESRCATARRRDFPHRLDDQTDHRRRDDDSSTKRASGSSTIPSRKFIPEFADLQVMQDGRLVPLDRPMTMRHLMATCAGFAFLVPMGSTNPKLDEMYLRCRSFQRHQRRLHRQDRQTAAGSATRHPVPVRPAAGGPGRHHPADCPASRSTCSCGRRIFGPLGMVDTGFGVAAEQRERIAPRYALDENLKLEPRSRPVAVPGAGRHSAGGQAEVSAVDRRAVFDRAGLLAVRADAGQRRNTRRRKDSRAVLGRR